MRQYLHVILVPALLLLRAPAYATDTHLEHDLRQLMAWFPGRYDNGEQLYQQQALDVPQEQRNYRRHSIFRSVELPAFGNHVLYAEQYRDGDPANIYRQRIYVFTVDETEQAIRLRIHIPNNTTALRGAYRTPELLSGLEPADTITWPGCDVFWQRQANQFIGRLKKGECRFQSKRFQQEVVLDEYLILTPQELWFADRGESINGEYLFGMKGDVPAKSVKARPFKCRVTVKSESPDNRRSHTVWLHDQGGEATIAFNSSASMARLRLRQKQALNDNEMNQLRLYVWDGQSMTQSAGATSDSGYIGLDGGALQVSCRHEPSQIYLDNSSD